MRYIFTALCMVIVAGSVYADDSLIDMSSSPWTLEISGFSHHFSSPPQGHEWTQDNWGAGIEYSPEVINSAWYPVYTLGTLKDSFGVQGAYTGIASFTSLMSTPSTTIDPGAGLFAMWRTFKWGGERKWVVVPLPLLHLDNPPSGMGLTITYAPRVLCEMAGVHTGFIFAQFTKKF